MKNNFQQWQDAEENRFHGFDEIENNLVRQVETFSFFGKVIELFIPNALNTVAKMIGGNSPHQQSDVNNQRGAIDIKSDWRAPLSRKQGPNQAP